MSTTSLLNINVMNENKSHHNQEIIVKRFFTEIGDESHRDQPPQYFDKFFDKSAIVVCGDPGSGKTTSFKHAAELESNAEYATVRDFINFPTDRYKGKILFLDALDEMRSHSEDGRTAIDQIRARLYKLGRPFFRLSCRAFDWYGSFDQKSISSVSADGKITVIQIESLGESEISQIVASREIDPNKFINEAKNRDIFNLIENPQTLNMMIDVVGKGGWPNTRAELYQEATKILVKEVNEDHRRAQRFNFSNNDLLNAAGYIFTVLLCGGTQGVALEAGASCGSHFDLNLLGGDLRVVHEAARRRLFRASGFEKSDPVHRTIAEYLSAKYMCNLIKKGLPLKRLLALITGYDGGTLSDLRGLYAWLTCLCKEHTETLLDIDPLSVVYYGDVSLLYPACKKLLIKKIGDYHSRNPWLSGDSWIPESFGVLASSEMEPHFRDILHDQNQKEISLRCVLDAIQYGQPLPSLGNLLLAFVQNNEQEFSLRVNALKAFKIICSNRIDDLASIMDDINSCKIKDSACRMRGILLRWLYPLKIDPDNVFEYIVNIPESYVGSYSMWIKYNWLPSTPNSGIPKLLDGIVNLDSNFKKTRYPFSDFLGDLLIKGLSDHGERVSSEKLYNWLGLASDRHGTFKLNREHRQMIQEWIKSHPDQYQRIYEYWLLNTKPEQLEKQIYRLHDRLCRVEYPDGFAQWLLELAIEHKDGVVANFLFREAAQLRTWRNRSDAPTVDEFFQIVHMHQRFEKTWNSELSCEIDKWRQKQSQRVKSEKKKKETERKVRVHQYTKLIDLIRSGKHIGALIQLAEIYLGHFYDVNNDLEPRKRIESVSNAECANAAIEGFLAVLKTPPPETPDISQIALSKVKSKIWYLGAIVIAGMDILVERKEDIIGSYSDNVLSIALAFYFASESGREREWVNEIIQKRPGLASNTLKTYWQILLEHKCNIIDGLYYLPRDKKMVPIAKRISLDMLRKCPNCETIHLTNLLWAALLYSDKLELLKVAKNVLGKPNAVKNLQRVVWYTTAFVLDSKNFRIKIKKYIGKDQEKAGMILSFLRPTWPEKMDLLIQDFSITVIEMLIEICGSVFKPRDNNYSFSFNDNISAVMGIIDKLSENPTNEATQTIDKLIKHPPLASWNKALTYAKERQIKHRREKVFRYPEIKQVVETIDNGAPANPSDLQALVLNHLLTIKADIQYGSTDAYKTFWNTDSHENTTTPCHEGVCRDRLLDRLSYRLNPLGIAAEREGDYSKHKRADIKILYMSSMNLPIEIKKHYHSDLWTAPKNQLKKLYSKDPAAGGRGIYLVFWFGICSDPKIPPPPPPPNGIEKPHNPEQLENSLREILSRNQAIIEILVIDCSGGPTKK